jgi:8-oxo-dGTP pyrophosphatase MutT (NUDIX family)
MSLKLDLTVAAIAEDDGRFLFVQERAARRVVLNQPAGHLEAGESLVEAVVRETREETGRAFHPDAVTGLYLWQGPAGRMILRIAFAGRVGERDDAARLDRAIIRTLWLDRTGLAARAVEHHPAPSCSCASTISCAGPHPLDMLNHVPLDGLAIQRAAG